jgi:sortase A
MNAAHRHTRSPARRLVGVLFAGLLVSGIGAVWMGRADKPAARADTPLLAAVPRSTTTSIVEIQDAVPVTAQPQQRVSVPRNAYAPEPVQLIGQIEIPKIGLVSPIYHGITMRNIDLGPSHWPGTAFPGETGNAVFAGHRVTHTHPFRNIDQLVPGDRVIFTVNGVRSVYSVTGSMVVKPSQLEITDPTPTPTATIFGCHPPGSARFRYVVKMALTTE